MLPPPHPLCAAPVAEMFGACLALFRPVPFVPTNQPVNKHETALPRGCGLWREGAALLAWRVAALRAGPCQMPLTPYTDPVGTHRDPPQPRSPWTSAPSPFPRSRGSIRGFTGHRPQRVVPLSQAGVSALLTRGSRSDPAAASTVRQGSIPSTCSGRGHTRASTAAASLLFPPGHSPHPGRGLILALEPTLRSRLRLQLGLDLGQVMFVCPVSTIPRSPPRTIINLEGLAPALRELSICISCDYLTCPEPRQICQPALFVW